MTIRSVAMCDKKFLQTVAKMTFEQKVGVMKRISDELDKKDYRPINRWACSSTISRTCDMYGNLIVCIYFEDATRHNRRDYQLKFDKHEDQYVCTDLQMTDMTGKPSRLVKIAIDN